MYCALRGWGPVWRGGCHLDPGGSACGVGSPLVGLLAVAAQRASLLQLPLAGECHIAGEAPDLHEVLADVRWQLPRWAASGVGQPPGALLVLWQERLRRTR